MKSRIPFEKRNPAGAVAAKREIQRQLVETGKEYELEVDALFLWVLHEHPKYRIGLRRMKELYEDIFRARKEIHDFYMADPEMNKHIPKGKLDSENRQITYWVFLNKLKSYGFDIETEFKRLDEKYKLD